MNYYSQYKQDYWVDKLLNKKENGFFLDIGANDGKTISNSYFFEKNRRWNGICVEPIYDVYEKLIKNRNCISLNACASDKNGKEVFFRIEGHSEMLSGIKSDYHPTHWNRILRDVASEGDKIIESEVDTILVNDILEKHKIRNIDFLSIDTEGSELRILKAIDFSKFNFSIICVENPYDEKEFVKFLSKHGFKLTIVLECDYLFINKSHTQLYKTAFLQIVITSIGSKIPIMRLFMNGYNRLRAQIKKIFKFLA